MIKEIYCPKCDKILEKDSKFCIYCGTKAIEIQLKEKEYERFLILECLYGPPYRVKCVCKHCGKIYIKSGLGFPREQYYCKECGKKVYKK